MQKAPGGWDKTQQLRRQQRGAGPLQGTNKRASNIFSRLNIKTCHHTSKPTMTPRLGVITGVFQKSLFTVSRNVFVLSVITNAWEIIRHHG